MKPTWVSNCFPMEPCCNRSSAEKKKKANLGISSSLENVEMSLVGSQPFPKLLFCWLYCQTARSSSFHFLSSVRSSCYHAVCLVAILPHEIIWTNRLYCIKDCSSQNESFREMHIEGSPSSNNRFMTFCGCDKKFRKVFLKMRLHTVN